MLLRAAIVILVLTLFPTHAFGAAKINYTVKARDIARLPLDMRPEVSSLLYLLNAFQQKQFFSLDNNDDRRAWIERFWREHDPTPTIPGNPMREIHNKRVYYARVHYPNDTWPEWDDRGATHIRYGEPDYRGDIKADVGPRGVRPHVKLWYYKSHNMLIAFEDFAGKGAYSFATSKYGPAEFVSPSLVEFLLWDENESYGGIIPMNVLEPDFFSHGAITGEQTADPERTYRSMESNQLMQDGTDMARNTQIVFEDVPSSYPYNFAQNLTFPFSFDVTQFKGGDDLNRIEVNVEFPVGGEDADPALTEYHASFVLYDHDYNEVERGDRKLTLHQPEEQQSQPAQVYCTGAPGHYRVAVSVRAGSTRISSYWTTIGPKRFSDGLAVSDILFARSISPVEDASPFNRGATEVIPNPKRRYAQGAPLAIYFEIYNLMPDEDGLAQYEIAYLISTSKKKKRGFWDNFSRKKPETSSSFTATAYGSDEPVQFTIQTKNLDKDTYDLLITIKDINSQDVVERRSTFKIADD